MNIGQLKKKFLEEYPDYKNDIEKLEQYLEQQVEGASFYNRMTMQGIRVSDIIQCISFYIEIGQITKREPAKRYFSAIGQWFEYLFEHSDIDNPSLKVALGSPSSRSDSYLFQWKTFIERCESLKEKETYPALNDDQVAMLIKWTDSIIQEPTQAIDKDIAFKRLAAALCIRLMVLLGLTYRVVRMISFEDYDENSGILTVNGYPIILPPGLSYGFREYKKICTAKGFDTRHGYLFLSTSGEQWDDKTTSSSIPSFLNTQLKITSINSVVKYGIRQLLQQGISDSVILKLTGVRKDILDDCIDPAKDDSAVLFSYINSKVVGIPIYSSL